MRESQLQTKDTKKLVNKNYIKQLRTFWGEIPKNVLISVNKTKDKKGGFTMNREEMNVQIEKIRAQYAEKNEEEKSFDALRELDREVKRPAKTFAYVFGTAGALIMGTGMSLAMDVFGKRFRVPGVLVGSIGLGMICANYPMYQKMLNERKKEYAQDILDLTDNMIFEEE